MTEEQREERAQRLALARDHAPFEGYTPANQHTTPLEEGPFLIERCRFGFAGPYVQVARYSHEDGPPPPHTLREDLGFGRFRIKTLHGGGAYQVEVRGGDPWSLSDLTSPAPTARPPEPDPAAAYLNPPTTTTTQDGGAEKLISLLNEQATTQREALKEALQQLERVRSEGAEHLARAREEAAMQIANIRADHRAEIAQLSGRIQELQDEKVSLQLERATPMNPPTLIDQIDHIKAIRDALSPTDRQPSMLPGLIAEVVARVPPETVARFVGALTPPGAAPSAPAPVVDEDDYQLDDIDELAEELRSAQWKADDVRSVLNAAAIARQHPQPPA